jgi:hypothetical protein
VPNLETVPSSVKGFFKNLEQPFEGKCYKPRYSFVDNSPKQLVPGLEGPVPSMFKTLETLNPLTFSSILEFGADPTGSFVQMECKEDFTGQPSSDSQNPIMFGKTNQKKSKTIHCWVHLILFALVFIVLISTFYI